MKPIEATTTPSPIESATMDSPPIFKTDPEIQNLMPPLPDDKYEQLKRSILKEGCRDPLIIWQEERILLDGHHRFKICRENTTPYCVIEKSFTNRDSALLWVAGNQLARRNLSTWGKAKLVEKFRPIFKNLADDRMAAGGGDKKTPCRGSGIQNSGDPIRVDDMLGKLAGLSHDTIYKVHFILNYRAKQPDIIDRLDRDECSINHAFETIKNLVGCSSPENIIKDQADESDHSSPLAASTESTPADDSSDNTQATIPPAASSSGEAKVPVEPKTQLAASNQTGIAGGQMPKPQPELELKSPHTIHKKNSDKPKSSTAAKYYTAEELCSINYNLIQKIMNHVLDLILAVDQNDKARSDKYIRDLRNAITK